MSIKVAEVIVDELAGAGVEVAFGLPGVHNLELFAALEASSIRTIVVRHEATAAYAADAVGRLTGKAGVCLTTSGPGAANAVTAMGEAQASRSPLLHITTTVARRHLGSDHSKGVLHEHPRQRDIFVPVSKAAHHVDRADAVADTVREALAAAAEPTQAPTYIEFPTDLLAEPGLPASLQEDGAAPAPKMENSRATLRALKDALVAARRPAIWVGTGGAGSSELITRLAERLGAPIVLTHSAKRNWQTGLHALIPHYPPHEPAVGDLLAEADAVLVIGSDLDGMMTQEFRLELDSVLRIDADPDRAARDENYPSAHSVVGDASVVLGALLTMVEERADGWGEQAVARANAAAAEQLAGEDEAKGGLALIAALDRALGERPAAIACDMAVAGYWTGGYLPLSDNRRLLYPLGWGTLGFALPASIGAAAIADSGRVVAVCGDGGSLFSIGELATMVQEKLDITVVVHNDACYGMLAYDERRRFDRTFAVDLEAPDFVALAQSFGVPAWRTELGSELEPTLASAFAAEGPSLVEVVGELAPPRVTSARWPLAV